MRTEAAQVVPLSPRTAALPAWDRELLELILLEPAYISRIESTIDRSAIESDIARRIFDACLRLFHAEQPCDFQRLSLEFDDVETQNLLVTLAELSQAKASADREQWWHELQTSADRRLDERRRRQQLEAAQHSSDDAEALLERFCNESRTKQLSEFERRK
jgi:replicative DNA helicase